MKKKAKLGEDDTLVVEHPEGTKLVEVPEKPPSLACLIEPKMNHLKTCNFDVGTDDGFDMILATNNVGAPKLSQLDGQPLALVYWSAEGTVYQGEDDDDPREGVRLCLWDSDGVMWRTSSMGVVRQLDTIIQYKGRGPYDPPLLLDITHAETNNGRRTFNVTLHRKK